jgi:AmmeMemoRadiSam system protein A
MDISEDSRLVLLRAARESIRSVFGDAQIPDPDYTKCPELKKHIGAFVTLTINGELRGCIGYIIAQQPLFDVVCEAAKQAAFSDPRFPSLQEKELDSIQIEVSVLSDFTPIKTYEEIVIGKHGMLLEEGGRGLLLPQVAVEHKMNREEFLSAVCRKAGLYSEYWKERQLNIKVFTAEIFAEE